MQCWHKTNYGPPLAKYTWNTYEYIYIDAQSTGSFVSAYDVFAAGCINTRVINNSTLCFRLVATRVLGKGNWGLYSGKLF